MVQDFVFQKRSHGVIKNEMVNLEVMGTLLKFSMARENRPSGKKSILPTISFQGLC